MKNYLNELLKYGAIIGVVEIAASALGMMTSSSLISPLALVVYLYLMYRFTGQRAAQMPAARGFSYGDGWIFIVLIGLFSGFLMGVYEIFARNIFFTAQYEEAMAQAIGNMARSMPGRMSEFKEWMHMAMCSPAIILCTYALAGLIKSAFFGLFIAAFTSRRPDIFAHKQDE